MAKKSPKIKLTDRFDPTPDQARLAELAANPKHKIIAAMGGTRSGKTIMLMYILISRMLAYPNTRHAIFRDTLTNAKSTTIPSFKDCLKLMFGDQAHQIIEENKSDNTITFPNGSMVRFGALDDENSLERLMGSEYATIFLSEVRNMKNYEVVTKSISRLSQQATSESGKQLRTKLLIDSNPSPSKHWFTKLFHYRINPLDNLPLTEAERDQMAFIVMNPAQNTYLDPDFLETLKKTYRGDTFKQLIEGKFVLDDAGNLFTADNINQNRRHETPDHFDRLVIAVDPSISGSGDECGIVVAGLVSGHAYILEDASFQASPEVWAAKVGELFQSYQADLVIAEKNQGGDLVRIALQTAHSNLPVKLVHASRGKSVRAEPIATLYLQDIVHHTAYFEELEEQMCGLEIGKSTVNGKSPDRLDALVYAVSELLLSQPKRAVAMAQGGVNW